MPRSKIEVVELTQGYVDNMKGRMREADENESQALAHLTADEALQCSFDKAVLCWTALVDDVPVICWGVSALTMIRYSGSPWLMGTKDIDGIGFRVLRHSKKYVKEMLEKFDYLDHWVSHENKISMAWIKWCGFTIEKAVPIGADKKLFHNFWMTKGGN